MNTATLGQFILETARSAEKKTKIDEQQAAQVRDSLTERVSEKLEELRTLQRKAYEDSKTVTVF